MSRIACIAPRALAFASLLLPGAAFCQKAILPLRPTPAPLTLLQHVSGRAMGGQQPLIGSKVYMLAVGTKGYGTGATNLLSYQGNDYVTTDKNGDFDITGDYTCKAGTYVYMALVGGSSIGKNNPNSAIAEFDALGDCSQLSKTTNISINEVSTAAHTAALQQFMSVKADGTVIIGAPSTNAAGLKNAFANATNLVPFSAGLVTTDTSVTAYPAAEINTLADILASCINTSKPGSAACNALFDAINNPVDGTGTTTGAMYSIVTHPNRTKPVYKLLPAIAPFEPTLTSAPNDWTVGITYTGGSMYSPRYLAIDAAGNAFVFDCQVSCSQQYGPMSTAADKIVEFSPNGGVVKTIAGPAVHNVFGIAIDTAGDIYTSNDGTTSSGMGNTADSIGVIPASGQTPYAITSKALASPYQIVLDAYSNFYVTNQGSQFIDYVVPTQGTVTKASQKNDLKQPTGIALEPIPFPGITGILFAGDSGNQSIQTFLGVENFNNTPGFLQGIEHFNNGDVKNPQGVAVGANNNVWYVNSGGNTVNILTDTGNTLNATTTSGFGLINQVAVDGDGYAWIPSCNFNCSQPGGNQNPDSINVLMENYKTDTISVVTPALGFQNSSLNIPAALALDASGNVWVTNAGSASVTVLLGAAGPVQTPLQAAFIKGNIGMKP